jgi:hypothetical protein
VSILSLLAVLSWSVRAYAVLGIVTGYFVLLPLLYATLERLVGQNRTAVSRPAPDHPLVDIETEVPSRITKVGLLRAYDPVLFAVVFVCPQEMVVDVVLLLVMLGGYVVAISIASVYLGGLFLPVVLLANLANLLVRNTQNIMIRRAKDMQLKYNDTSEIRRFHSIDKFRKIVRLRVSAMMCQCNYLRSPYIDDGWSVSCSFICPPSVTATTLPPRTTPRAWPSSARPCATPSSTAPGTETHNLPMLSQIPWHSQTLSDFTYTHGIGGPHHLQADSLTLAWCVVGQQGGSLCDDFAGAVAGAGYAHRAQPRHRYW